ncbi:hypothetical protein BJ741DRAFT_612829 [Chytriomyces cf. hyalinus JEL632]|nr:hypothetical protein BJ741DRAFT_612829 [Chytriomyces cf. hyalinus JEL632]
MGRSGRPQAVSMPVQPDTRDCAILKAAFTPNLAICCSGPSSIGNPVFLQCDADGNVVAITVRTSLTGELPASLGNLTHLISLDLSRNHFSGSIPASYGNLKALTKLDLSNNRLTNTLPNELENLRNLTTLFLQSNQLTGSVPEDLSCTLAKNSISRPSFNNDCEIVSSAMQQMGYFLRIPPIQCCQWNSVLLGCDDFGFVTRINFGSSGLMGALPDNIFTLSQLQSINLNHNLLESTISSKLGAAVNLKQIDLSFNKLVGPLPESVKYLERLERAFFQNNQLSGNIPTAFVNMTQLSEFNFEHNHFTGSIPQGLSGFGFDHNCLSGSNLVNQQDCLEQGGVDARVAVGATAAVVVLIALAWWFRRVYQSSKDAQRSADTLEFVDPFDKELSDSNSLYWRV